MKKLLTIIAIFSLVVVVSAGDASAAKLIFGGQYDLLDLGGTAGFRETLRLDDTFFAVPVPVDPFFDGNEKFVFDDFIFDESSFTPGVSYDFSPTVYAGGVQLYDGATKIFEADITIETLDVKLAGGDINSDLSINLTNFSVGTYGGGSSIIDELLAYDVGVMTISLQFSGLIGDAIEGSTAFATDSFSGNLHPVPEPGTVLLLGVGLLGIVGIGRKRLRS